MLHKKTLNYTKEGSKIASELQNSHETHRKENDILKSNYINNNIKGEWIKQPNQNAETIRLDKKQEPNLFYLSFIHDLQKDGSHLMPIT